MATPDEERARAEELIRRVAERRSLRERTCTNCGDVVPVGWTLDDHFECNWPEDFA